MASFNHPDRDRKPGSIGTPIEGVRAAAGRARRRRRRGRRGRRDRGQRPQLMKGYWGRAEATREAIPDGWLRTGDLARQDTDGYFFIVDRKKDLIIRGGYNVYPREVEEVLYEHPAVAEAAVVGIPHPTHGEEVGAAVVLRPGVEAAPAELRAFCRERVAAYKYPRHVWLEAALPKTATGKVLRREVVPPDGPGTVSGQPADAAAPLDLLLAAAALGPARRLLPGGAGARFAAGLARRPDRLAQRATSLAGELARVGAGRSTLAPAPGDRRFSRPRLDVQPAAAPPRPGLPRRRGDRRGAGGRRRPGVARRRADAASLVDNLVRRSRPATSRLPARPSGGPLIDLGRRQRGPRRPEPGHRPGHAATGAVDGDARRVRGGRRPGGDPGRGGAAHAHVRADPVPAADPEGAPRAAADRPADDQQVLHRRPGARPQPGRVPGRAAASRCSSCPGATRTPGHRDWGVDAYGQAILEAMRRDPADLPGGQVAAAGALLGRHPGRDDPGPPGRRRGPGTGRRVRPGGDGARPGPGRDGGRVPGRADRPGGRRRLGGPRLPGRPCPGRGVRLAASRRPDLELLGQQLPPGPHAGRRSTSCTGTPTPPG